jgi:hypothetical protein
LIAGHDGYIVSDIWAKETVAMASIEGVLLEIDGTMCGTLPLAQGGDGFAPVVHERILLDQTKKHLEQLKWEDLELQLSLPLHRMVSDWITAMWRRQSTPRTVRITAYDSLMRVIRRREFLGALVTETTVPTLEAGSSGLGLLKLKLTPESVRTITPTGTVPLSKPPPSWYGATFRLDLPGLDCTKVMKIDSFTVNQQLVEASIMDRDQVMEPVLSFPNLAVTLLESSAATWQAWFDDFVVRGNNADDQEKTGRLSLLDGSLRERVRIDLFNVGIFRLALSAWTRDDSPLVVAGLYCERMDFTVVL